MCKRLHVCCRPFFTKGKGDDVGDLLFAFLNDEALLKRVYSLGKEFAHRSKFFPLRVDSFLEGRQI